MVFSSETRKTVLKYLSIFFIGLTCMSIGFCGWFSFKLIDTRNNAIPEDINQLKITLHPDTNQPDLGISGIIYYPESLTPTSPSLPAVVIQHGFGGIKENLASMALNFVKRGFVAATFDLRGHGESDGYFSFGDKESDDLAHVIEYLSNDFNGNYGNVSNIGIVGHSIGAVTSIMTSYKTNLNACVAISPAAFILDAFAMISGGNISKLSEYVGTKNPFSDPDFIDRINLTKYIENRVQEGEDAKTKNLLICTTSGDVTVESKGVYDFFKDVVQRDLPENDTLFGSFEWNNATQLNTYDGITHGDQQFTWISPQIAQDAINWTERALIGESESIARGSIEIDGFILTNFNKDSDLVQIWYIIAWLSLCSFVLTFFSFKTFEKESESLFFLPGELNFFIFSPNKRTSGDTMRRQNIILNSIFIVSMAIITGISLSSVYIPGYIGTMIPELALRPLILFTIPIIVFLVIMVIRPRRSAQDGRTQINQLLGIAENRKIMIITGLLGVVLGISLPGGLVLLSDLVNIECFLKPINYWSIYIISAFYVFFIVSICGIFLYGYVMRAVAIKRKKLRFLNPAVGALFQLIIAIGIAAVLFPLDPLFDGIVSYSGFVINLNIGIVFITAAAVFALGFALNIYVKATKSVMIPVMICTSALPWFLMGFTPVI